MSKNREKMTTVESTAKERVATSTAPSPAVSIVPSTGATSSAIPTPVASSYSSGKSGKTKTGEANKGVSPSPPSLLYNTHYEQGDNTFSSESAVNTPMRVSSPTLGSVAPSINKATAEQQEMLIDIAASSIKKKNHFDLMNIKQLQGYGGDVDLVERELNAFDESDDEGEGER